ncbi:AAA-ATPase At3g50940-like [Coffea eugenioides]|uniref:AAA-ATPase At3g50940-like n=1 Tax=Coffea eugenioides TaxID=49369 RepID=UPI000F60F7B6|nr:AAA-ATPase At3g50940-like [Coffea eugenioides]
MFSLNSSIPSTTSVLSAYTTFAASAVLVRTVLHEVQSMTSRLIPQQLQDKLFTKIGSLFGNLSSQMCITISDHNGLTPNEMFEACETYLRGNISPSVHRLKVVKEPKAEKLSVNINDGETTFDVFEGIHLVWRLNCSETQKTGTHYDGYFSSKRVERRSFELFFNKKYKDKVLGSYLPYVLERSKAINGENKVIKLYSGGNWYVDVNLQHPSTFDTLAMDPEVKKELMQDLDRFVRRRTFYKRVGKAWKRGYLLYGPPGTGKSSLVAAMANYLKFHIYDLELSSVRGNNDLRSLLVSTKNRSILVIEDIDCSIEMQNREAGQSGRRSGENQLTLSGLLNFIDGLWSSCGDERIVVFTTNYKERLDPALLRPGRMDMHIHLSYCTPGGFRILASNYLGLKDHDRFGEIEELITEVEVTAAEIAEELIKSEEIDFVLAGLVAFLEKKKKEKAKSNIGKEDEVKGNKKEEDVKLPRRSRRKRSRKSRI